MAETERDQEEQDLRIEKLRLDIRTMLRTFQLQCVLAFSALLGATATAAKLLMK